VDTKTETIRKAGNQEEWVFHFSFFPAFLRESAARAVPLESYYSADLSSRAASANSWPSRSGSKSRSYDNHGVFTAVFQERGMKLRVLVILLSLAGAAAALGLYFRPFAKKNDTLQLAGVIETQEIRLGSKIGGRVLEVSTVEGEIVEEGKVLVTFEAPELAAQKEQQEARVKAAQADWERAVNGPRPEEKQQAKDDVAAAEADVKQTIEDFERAERVSLRNAGTRADYDAARAARDRAVARRGMARARLDLLNAGTRYEEIDAALARLGEARGKLAELDANLKETVVRAPGKAVVEVLAVRKGDLVPANQPVLRILRFEDLWVRVYVPETELGKVRLHQQVQVTVDAYPDQPLTGEVIFISSESEFTPRNVQSLDERRYQVFGVKVQVANPKGILKSGMAAQVRLPLE
jgi:multidrug resistance efflux pump